MYGTAQKESVQLNGSKLDAAANAAAAVTIAGSGAEYWVLDTVHCSYKLGSGTTGMLTVAFAGTSVFEVDITANGVYEILFPKGLYTGTKNEEMVVTLAAGGALVIGKLTITYR